VGHVDTVELNLKPKFHPPRASVFFSLSTPCARPKLPDSPLARRHNLAARAPPPLRARPAAPPRAGSRVATSSASPRHRRRQKPAAHVPPAPARVPTPRRPTAPHPASAPPPPAHAPSRAIFSPRSALRRWKGRYCRCPLPRSPCPSMEGSLQPLPSPPQSMDAPAPRRAHLESRSLTLLPGPHLSHSPPHPGAPTTPLHGAQVHLLVPPPASLFHFCCLLKG
jgi:hypothetical protein